MENLTFANNLLSEYARLQSQPLPAIKEEEQICDLCGRVIEDHEWFHEFDEGAKWCAGCYTDEKCR